jgi:hypothetical protein
LTGFGYTPSNVPVVAYADAGDITVSATNCLIDTDALTVSCVSQSASGVTPYLFATGQQSDGSQVAVLSVHSLTVPQAAQVTVRGSIPLIVFAQTTVNIQGELTTSTPGNAGGPQVLASGAGGGPGGGTAGPSGAGAGGGGYCGTGGQGAPAGDAGAPTPGGRAYGTPQISPLIGGSAGGNHGSYADGGEGGGAIQISAGTSIIIGSGGVINVPGLGAGNIYGGGGGSGGAVLLEAPSVTVDGIIAVNGGGAGEGTPNSSGGGQSGQPSMQPAAGGASFEGNGGAGTQIDGSDGQVGATTGNGGGAAGRIRINTTTGAATVGANALISPALTTSCATQGTLGP